MSSALLPHNIEIEEAILGGLLLQGNTIHKVTEIVTTPSMFYVRSHQYIFSACVQLASKDHQIDLMTVANQLTNNNHLDTIGGYAKLAQLVDRTVSAVNIARYAKILQEKWFLRQVIFTCGKYIELANAPVDSVDALKKDFENDAFALLRDKEKYSDPESLIDILLRKYQQITSDKPVSQILATNILDLDQIFDGGVLPTEIIMIAARPAIGKTAVAVHTALSINKSTDKAIHFFSAEMSKDRIGERFLSNIAGIDNRKFKIASNSIDGEKKEVLTEDEHQRLLDVFVNGEQLYRKFVVDDIAATALTPERIRSRLNDTVLEFGGIGAIFFDYAQLLGASEDSSGYGNRNNELGKFAREFQSLAREFNCPVFLLSQLNRGVEQRQNKRPMMSDLRDSGELEQAADKIIGLYRDEYYNPETPDKGIIELIVLKNRDGQSCGTAKALFVPEFSAIWNLANAEPKIYDSNF